MNLLKAADISKPVGFRASNEKKWGKLARSITKSYGEGKNKKLQGFDE